MKNIVRILLIVALLVLAFKFLGDELPEIELNSTHTSAAIFSE